MLSRVLETISRYNMLPEGSRVIVAVSGGADSVCLLHALRELAPTAVVGVAHLNHQLRGDASDQDQQFVAELARSLDLSFHCISKNVGTAGGNLEEAGHFARKEYFSSLRDALHCDLIALGHTRDDQAETVLFRLLRGSGLTGLAGIAPCGSGLIRPLIETTRAEIEEFLKSRNIPWHEDATNTDLRFARNRIRHQLLPHLAAQWNPQISRTLANLASLAQDEETYWTSEIDKLSRSEFVLHLNAVELRWSSLTALPKAVARRLLRRAIADAKGDPRQIQMHHVNRILDIHRHLRLPGLQVTRSFDWLRLQNGPDASLATIPVPAPGAYPSPNGSSQICVKAAQSDPCATLKLEVFPLELRGWLPGDHYRPKGLSRDHKIQELFQKARVPSWKRASWPILTSGNKILWSRQFGPAEGCTLQVRES